MKAPLVSVIIPVYDTASMIGNCLQPLLNGTTDDIEIIICNDGSTAPGTVQILDTWAHLDDRIHLLHHATNRGAASARNDAIKLARGEWLSFADADDIPFQSSLARLLTTTQSNTEVVIGNMLEQQPDGRFELGYWNTWMKYGPLASETWKEKHRLETLYGFGGSLCDKLFRRRFYEDQCIRHHEESQVSTDTMAVFECLLNANHVTFQCLPVYYWLHRTGSLSRSVDYSKYLSSISLFDVAQRLFENSKYDDKTKIVIALRMLRIAYYYGVVKAPSVGMQEQYVVQLAKHSVLPMLHVWAHKWSVLPFIPSQWHKESLDILRRAIDLV